MNSYFDRDVLMQSSIFELRNIARDIGVYSPTIYKKEQLINKIFEIVNGETKPHVPKSKQGRPPKTLSDPVRKNVFDKVLPTERQYEISPTQVSYLSQSMRAYLEDDAVKAKRYCDISGVLELSKSGYGFIREVNIEYTQSSGAFVSETLIQHHNLKAGDFITGKAKLLEEDKPYVLFEVSSVNDKENHSYISFEDQNVVCALTQLNINDEISNLLVGASNIIAQNKENKKLPKEYIEQIQNKYTLVYVGLELNKEQELLLKDVAGEVYYTSMVAPCLEHINLVKFALARAKRLATFGKDVVLFIDSIDKVVKNQNLTLDNNLFDIKINTLDIVKELAISSRQFSVEGSLTVLGLYNYQQDNIFDANIIGELSNYYSKIYKSN